MSPTHSPQALTEYHEDVVGGHFPGEAYSPYKIPAPEAQQLLRELEREGLGAAAAVVADHAGGAGSSEGGQ